jgi:hypothetical protein
MRAFTMLRFCVPLNRVIRNCGNIASFLPLASCRDHGMAPSMRGAPHSRPCGSSGSTGPYAWGGKGILISAAVRSACLPARKIGVGLLCEIIISCCLALSSPTAVSARMSYQSPRG